MATQPEGGNMEPFDVVVIGAGIVGSSAAYQCVKAGGGKRVLLLEQFALPHSRGGSQGGNRMYVITGSGGHLKMLKESYSLWKTMEEETKMEILRENGYLIVTERDKAEGFAAQLLDDIEKSGEPYERLSEEERARRFPHFTSNSKIDSLFFHKAGVIRANKALKTYQDEFLRRGGILKDEEKMLEIIPGAIVTIKTNKGVYQARSLILAVGTWTPKVLDKLGVSFPCEIVRSHHIFWKEKTEGMYRDFPCFQQPSSESVGAYGFPSREYSGLMKVGEWVPTTIPDPDLRDSLPGTSEEIKKAREYVREHLPGLDADNGPAITEACLLLVTEDDNIVLDVHPDHSNISFLCGDLQGCFQFAPVLGKILSQLAFGDPVSHDLQPWSIKRFLK